MSSAVVGALRVVLGIDTTAFSQGLDSATGKLKAAGRDLGRIGSELSLKVTAPLTLAGGLILNTAGQFEAAMNRIGAATGAGAGDMAAFEKLARDLGKSTTFSAGEAAEAIEMLAKNGVSTADILGGALTASLDLAAASGSDLASAADLSTDVMLNFGKGASDLGKVVDGVSGVLLASKFGFDDYRLALAQAGGVAGGLGVTLDDFNAVIAATSARFASGADAGTSFKTFLQRLVPSSKAAADAMDRLNLEFFDGAGNLKPMAEVAEELRRALGGLSDEAKSEALTDIFGTDAMRTAIGLMEAGAKGVMELDAAIGSADAAEQAAARTKGWAGAMEQLGGALDELALAVADAGLIDMATDLARRVTDLVDSVSEADPALLRFGVAAGACAAAIGPLLVAAGLVATGIAAVASPVGLAVTAIAALTAAGIALYQNWDLVAEKFPVVTGAVESFGRAVGVVAAGMGEQLGLGVQALGQALRGDFAGALDSVGQQTVAFGATVLNLADVAFPGARAAAEAFATDIGTRFVEGIDAALAAFGELDTYLAGVREQLLQAGRQMIDGLLQGLKEKWENVKAWFGSLAESIPGWIRDPLGIHSPSTVFAEIGQNIMQGLVLGLDAGRVGVGAQLTSVADGIPGVFQQVGQAAASQFTGLVDALVDGSARGGDALRGLEEDLKRLVLNKAFSSVLGSLFGQTGYFPIPGFAAGTRSAPGGLAIVGERGPELVNLPGGSQVIPNHALGGLGGGAAKVEVIIHNAPAGTQVEEKNGPGGTRQIEIFLRDQVRNMIGQGALDGVLRDNFGVGRRPRGV